MGRKLREVRNSATSIGELSTAADQGLCLGQSLTLKGFGKVIYAKEQRDGRPVFIVEGSYDRARAEIEEIALQNGELSFVPKRGQYILQGDFVVRRTPITGQGYVRKAVNYFGIQGGTA